MHFRKGTTHKRFFPVPDMKTGSCLDPGENGTGLEGGGKTGLGPPERGKERQLKPSRNGDKGEEPTRT